MPGRKAFLIAKEYLRFDEPTQVRKNAITALAALDDPESREILAKQAIEEIDPDVRQRAQSEIAKMPPGWSEHVLATVSKDLEVREPRHSAYVLLGELRNRGLSIPFPSMPLGRRLRLAKAMRDARYPHRGFKFVFRSFAGALFGTLLAWAVLVALCFGLGFHVDWSVDLVVLFGACLMATLLASASTFFSSPAGFFPDWWGGALIDMISVSVTFLVVSVIVIVYVAATSVAAVPGAPAAPKIRTPYYLLLLAPLVGAAIKVGTMATFGVATGKWLNRVVQTFTGGSCAVAVLELVLITSGKTADDFLTSAWLWIVLASYGLAGGFSWIDSQAERRAVVPPAGRMVALLVTAVCMLFNLCQLVPLPVEKADLGKIGPTGTNLDVHRVPQRRSLEVASVCELTAAETPEASGYELSLMGPSGPQTIYPLNPLRLEPTVKYQIEISRDQNHTDLVSIIPQMVKQMSWSHFTARFSSHEPIGMAPLLKVEIKCQ